MTAQGTLERPPSDTELEHRLGTAQPAFAALLAALPGARREWKKYGRTSDWVLKLVEGKRTMCYVQPRAGAFQVTVVLGVAAADRALASAIPRGVKDAIREARVYVEGRPVPVVVRSEAEVPGVLALLEAKRGPAGPPRKRR